MTNHSDGGISLIFASFSPFTVLTVLINPWSYGGRLFTQGGAGDIITGRIELAVASWIAAGAYAAIVWAMYKAMVKNFDMTIRKQSR